MKIFFHLTLLCCLSIACNNTEKEKELEKVEKSIDLAEIRDRGKIIALTDNSTTSYYIYKGQAMGFEYELLERFASKLGIPLEIKVVNSVSEMMALLNAGEGDIIAANLTITGGRKKQVDFSIPLLQTKQVLVQQIPKEFQNHSHYHLDKILLRNVSDLAGETIHVRENSSFAVRLKNLNEEIGGGIKVVELDGSLESEQLIAMVAYGDIKYTIADEHIALLNQKYFLNIDAKTPISLEQQIAWAVRKNSTHLLDTLNAWLAIEQNSKDFYTIRNRYFKAVTMQNIRKNSNYSSLSGNRISPFDSLIRKHAEIIGWDWKLIAAQIFQESRFDENAESWRGAKGLMQIMPATAERYNIIEINDPAKNIEAGVRYMSWLHQYWQNHISDSLEAIKFTLASFNVGLGHVKDAVRLAEKNGANTTIWENNVAVFLAKKSNPKYYQDEVVKHGYCRGKEPVEYVNKVFANYKHYQNLYADL